MNFDIELNVSERPHLFASRTEKRFLQPGNANELEQLLCATEKLVTHDADVRMGHTSIHRIASTHTSRDFAVRSVDFIGMFSLVVCDLQRIWRHCLRTHTGI